MTDLDDLERLAREYVYAPCGVRANDLASAVLVMLPVVRAAEVWNEHRLDERVYAAVMALEEAIDAFHASRK